MPGGRKLRWACVLVCAALSCRSADSVTPPSTASAALEAAPPAEAPEPPEQAEPAPLQVAITVDDLPAHGPEVGELTQLEIHRRLLEAFATHEVPQVYGFINADKLAGSPELRAPLQAWVEAGHPLGNHTHTHASLREVDLEAYFQDIAANEPTIEAMVPPEERTPTFRYPYLLEGMSRKDTLAIREHLAERGYRIAPVTIDFYDWAFNGAFVRCTKAKDERAVAALRSTFIAHALEMLSWSDAAAQAMYGRRIPQVLLLHAGAIDAVMIEDLLTQMEAQGVQWVTLDAALADPAYAETYVKDGRNQGTLLDQRIDTQGVEHPPRHTHPRALLEAICRGT